MAAYACTFISFDSRRSVYRKNDLLGFIGFYGFNCPMFNWWSLWFQMYTICNTDLTITAHRFLIQQVIGYCTMLVTVPCIVMIRIDSNRSSRWSHSGALGGLLDRYSFSPVVNSTALNPHKLVSFLKHFCKERWAKMGAGLFQAQPADFWETCGTPVDSQDSVNIIVHPNGMHLQSATVYCQQ